MLINLIIFKHLLVNFVFAGYIDGSNVFFHERQVNVEHEDLIFDLIFYVYFIFHQSFVVKNFLLDLLINNHLKENRELRNTNKLGAFGIKSVIGPIFLELVNGFFANF